MSPYQRNHQVFFGLFFILLFYISIYNNQLFVTAAPSMTVNIESSWEIVTDFVFKDDSPYSYTELKVYQFWWGWRDSTSTDPNVSTLKPFKSDSLVCGDYPVRKEILQPFDLPYFVVTVNHIGGVSQTITCDLSGLIPWGEAIVTVEPIVPPDGTFTPVQTGWYNIQESAQTNYPNNTKISIIEQTAKIDISLPCAATNATCYEALQTTVDVLHLSTSTGVFVFDHIDVKCYKLQLTTLGEVHFKRLERDQRYEYPVYKGLIMERNMTRWDWDVFNLITCIDPTFRPTNNTNTLSINAFFYDSRAAKSSPAVLTMISPTYPRNTTTWPSVSPYFILHQYPQDSICFGDPLADDLPLQTELKFELTEDLILYQGEVLLARTSWHFDSKWDYLQHIICQTNTALLTCQAESSGINIECACRPNPSNGVSVHLRKGLEPFSVILHYKDVFNDNNNNLSIYNYRPVDPAYPTQDLSSYTILQHRPISSAPKFYGSDVQMYPVNVDWYADLLKCDLKPGLQSGGALMITRCDPQSPNHCWFTVMMSLNSNDYAEDRLVATGFTRLTILIGSWAGVGNWDTNIYSYSPIIFAKAHIPELLQLAGSFTRNEYQITHNVQYNFADAYNQRSYAIQVFIDFQNTIQLEPGSTRMVPLTIEMWLRDGVPAQSINYGYLAVGPDTTTNPTILSLQVTPTNHFHQIPLSLIHEEQSVARNTMNFNSIIYRGMTDREHSLEYSSTDKAYIVPRPDFGMIEIVIERATANRQEYPIFTGDVFFVGIPLNSLFSQSIQVSTSGATFNSQINSGISQSNNIYYYFNFTYIGPDDLKQETETEPYQVYISLESTIFRPQSNNNLIEIIYGWVTPSLPTSPTITTLTCTELKRSTLNLIVKDYEYTYEWYCQGVLSLNKPINCNDYKVLFQQSATTCPDSTACSCTHTTQFTVQCHQIDIGNGTISNNSVNEQNCSNLNKAKPAMTFEPIILDFQAQCNGCHKNSLTKYRWGRDCTIKPTINKMTLYPLTNPITRPIVDTTGNTRLFNNLSYTQDSIVIEFEYNGSPTNYISIYLTSPSLLPFNTTLLTAIPAISPITRYIFPLSHLGIGIELHDVEIWASIAGGHKNMININPTTSDAVYVDTTTNNILYPTQPVLLHILPQCINLIKAVNNNIEQNNLCQNNGICQSNTGTCKCLEDSIWQAGHLCEKSICTTLGCITSHLDLESQGEHPNNQCTMIKHETNIDNTGNNNNTSIETYYKPQCNCNNNLYTGQRCEIVQSCKLQLEQYDKPKDTYCPSHRGIFDISQGDDNNNNNNNNECSCHCNDYYINTNNNKNTPRCTKCILTCSNGGKQQYNNCQRCICRAGDRNGYHYYGKTCHCLGLSLYLPINNINIEQYNMIYNEKQKLDLILLQNHQQQQQDENDNNDYDNDILTNDVLQLLPSSPLKLFLQSALTTLLLDRRQVLLLEGNTPDIIDLLQQLYTIEEKGEGGSVDDDDVYVINPRSLYKNIQISSLNLTTINTTTTTTVDDIDNNTDNNNSISFSLIIHAIVLQPQCEPNSIPQGWLEKWKDSLQGLEHFDSLINTTIPTTTNGNGNSGYQPPVICIGDDCPPTIIIDEDNNAMMIFNHYQYFIVIHIIIITLVTMAVFV